MICILSLPWKLDTCFLFLFSFLFKRGLSATETFVYGIYILFFFWFFLFSLEMHISLGYKRIRYENMSIVHLFISISVFCLISLMNGT